FFQAEDGIRAFHVTGVQTCALPIYGAGKARRLLVRKQLRAHEGMKAVGADQDISASGLDMRAVAVEEIGADAGLILTEGAETVAGMDTRFAKPGAGGGIDYALQPAAVDG